jgi:hypothetical protein
MVRLGWADLEITRDFRYRQRMKHEHPDRLRPCAEVRHGR